ncbi:helix-turn-helix transcriptional regulator [Streptomyces sp. NBC_00669]|uniref:helix-turn-helix domain-containing protein n=1 Tax=Streptomyces sp. NBC_00669 TaxID=2976011 RepID=UPI002E2F17EC|nr:helix-turn-helix transcriptional regulator [Streptomyces sp. NBC_00669]
MTQPKNLSPYASPQSFYGSELRRLREAAHLTQDQLGERVFCSGGYIGQLETAIRRPQLDLSQRLDATLGTDGHLERICLMVLRATKHAEYFAEVAELMATATSICRFASQLIPGVLQTEAYARALIRASMPFASDERIEELVQARRERAETFTDPATPRYWVILHESALRLPICDAEGMHHQLTHILEVAHAPGIMLQVIPYSAGAHAMAGSNVTLMTFEDAPPAVYVEGPYSGHLLDSPTMVAEHQQAYDCARAAALSPEASLNLISSVAEEYSRP